MGGKMNVQLFCDNSLQDFGNEEEVCDGSIVGKDLFVQCRLL